MTTSRGARAKTTLWFSGLAGVAVVACGNLKSSRQDAPVTSPAGNANTAQAGTHGGGARNGAGGTSGGVTLTLPTAGTQSSNTPLDPGTAGEGGQPDYPATVRLCITDEDIPDNWGAGGAVSVGTAECARGVLGPFDFMGCQYQLLDTEPRNVDVFLGGHSPCCYASKLIACK